jgi:N-acetylneuraminic acid mutarotase
MSQARFNLGVVALDDKIYAIGGQTDEADGYVGTNEQYDPKKDTWFTLKSMPTSRSKFGIVAYEGKIYCIGGSNTKGFLYVNEVYDVATDQWSTKKPLPIGPISRLSVQAHVVDGKIFVIAARLLYMYDSVTDLWTQKASLPQTVASDPYVYSAVVDNQIIVIINDEYLESCKHLFFMDTVK